ncbi:hypothetical protein ELI_2076 [Eubacterium callanderi]|uniref:Uncharacterized protein n=1 Tax=Eubacterium callanderi TaxID=53442 RepID=E3GMJ6_9FIRM|nr:hypothetical protein ELI_2076 [Eubacterium callanderi]
MFEMVILKEVSREN